MRNKHWILAICCLAIFLTSCSPKNRVTSDEAISNTAPQETASVNTALQMMEEELQELSQYQGIIDTSTLTEFYNLDSEENTSALSRSIAQGFPKTGKYQYFYTENDVLMLAAVALKDGMYYELLYNTVDGSSSVNTYTALRTEETEETGTDNIKRRQTLFFLENVETSKYIGKDVRNLTESEVVDILKKYKGNMDKSAYEIWGNPGEILSQNYSAENGLTTDFKYITEIDEVTYLCGVNLAPNGYCLTVYDPEKDWFEVEKFSHIYCVLTADGTKEYYLSNLPQEYDYKKNTIPDIKNDGYLYITSEIN